MATIDEAIARWLLPYTGKTAENYSLTMRVWLRWCDLNGLNPMGVTRSHLEAWCAWLAKHYADSTARSYVGIIARFYQYMYDEQILATNPGVHIRKPRQYTHSTGSFLDADQAKQFLTAAQVQGSQAYALCALLLLSGPRISEALGLDVEDFDADKSLVYYARKGHYDQQVRVSEIVVSSLSTHLGRRKHGPIFRSSDGKRLQATNARRLVRKLGESIGVPDVTPHSLRRTFCTLVVDAGVPERDIMAAGGWGSREMVDYYYMRQRGRSQTSGDAVACLLGL